MGSPKKRRRLAGGSSIVVGGVTMIMACSTLLEADGDGVLPPGADAGREGSTEGAASSDGSGDDATAPSGPPCIAGGAKVCALGKGVSPQHISAHASYVYFAEASGKLSRISKAGGAIEGVFSTFPVPTCLSSSSSGLYWCSEKVIQRAPIGGPTTAKPGELQDMAPTRVQTRPDFVAWTVRFANEVYTSNGEFTDGGTIETTAIAPVAIAVDREFVYYAESGSPGKMMRRTHAGAKPSTVGAGDGGTPPSTFDAIAAIAVGAKDAVWVDAQGVYRKPTDSDAAFADGPAIVLDTTRVKGGVDVVVDDTTRKAYVLTKSGKLWVVPLDGGPLQERGDVRPACAEGRGMAHEDDPPAPSDPYVYLACATSILRVEK